MYQGIAYYFHLIMKGSQISPWSIYNQNTINNRDQVQNEARFILPKIKAAKSPQEKQRSKRHSLPKQYSKTIQQKQTKQLCEPYQSEQMNASVQADTNITDMILRQQKELQKIIEQRVIVQIISQSVKKQICPYKMDDYQDEESDSNQRSQFNFPKLNLQKYMAAMGLQDKSEALDKKMYKGQTSSQALKLLIKNEIKSRIKAKMVIMGKSKDITRK